MATSFREITDQNGRIYRVGESAEDIMGRSQAWMVFLPWIAMMAVSVFEYGWSSAEDTIAQVHGWTLSDTLWLAGVWAVFQAGVAFPAGKLREKDILSARTAMLLGAVCSAIGYLTIAHSNSMVLAYIGYSVFGGTGAGLVYATCINMVGKWYPEKRGARTGFVNGGFAYGTIPFIFVFAYVFNPGNFSLVFDLIAVYMLVVVAWCGFMFKDPPKNWWPAQVDPLAPRGKAAASLAKNPPAVRQFTPMQAIRTGMLPLMWVCLVLIGGVSLFGINTQAVFARGSGFGPALVAFSAALLAFVNGVGRGLCGWLSDTLGRKQTLTLILVIAAIGQFGVLYAGNTGSQWLLIVFAIVNGFGSGAFYPMFATLVPDYFGENNNASNYGLVYSAKLVSGLGVGLSALVITAWGFTGAYILAGCLALLSAVLTFLAAAELTTPLRRGKLDHAHSWTPACTCVPLRRIRCCSPCSAR